MSDDCVLATLSVTMEASDHQVVIAVQGEIDVATAETLERALNAIDVIDCRTVVVDLSEVSFIDSSGLKALLTGRRDLARRDIGLVVRNPQPQARRLFEVSEVLKSQRLLHSPSILLLQLLNDFAPLIHLAPELEDKINVR
jgi:anti-anti-sigma factor